jgi:hypothetical protein
MIRKVLMACCAAALPLLASAQTIAGGVYEDGPGLALRQNFTPAAGVTVLLYGQNGTALTRTTTDAAGQYRFKVSAPGEYWLAVDSKTLRRGEGTWAEQTFGPGGALCAQPDGNPRSNFFPGACIGGRSIDAADDASTLPTAEHVARVTAAKDVLDADFAFSFNVVSTSSDGTTQGSIRQFVRNANAIPGGNRMRFVPIWRAPVQRETSFGAPPRWWAINLGAPLAELTDDDTTIDGTAYSFVSPDSALDPNPGHFRERPTIRAGEWAGRQERPDLELVTAGETGIVCAARCGIRALAIHGSPLSILLQDDARLEHVVVGIRPDETALGTRGSVGIQIERGTTLARDIYVTEQSRAGIAVAAAGAKLDGERIDVTQCGEPEAGGGIVLFSDGSSVRNSNIMENRGAGVIIGSADGRLGAHVNTIDGSTISSNWTGVLLSPAASRNAITRNQIMWNRMGGVVLAPYQATTPQENRISANRYNENGNRPIVLDLTAPANVLASGEQTCARKVGAPNGGLTAPDIRSVRHVHDNGVDRVLITGRACAGETVELYQSFVTSSVREVKDESSAIRNEQTERRETLTTAGREFGLPSIGEFNYVGTTSTGPDGVFEASFPILVTDETQEHTRAKDEEVSIWHDQILRQGEVTDRAFSAVAIDAAGNTSEMSVRRAID